MNIALVGYGKMGHAVERIALQRGHRIVAAVDILDDESLAQIARSGAEAVIEFTVPSAAVANYRRLLPLGLPLVSGTTAWRDDPAAVAEVEALAAESPAGLFWSSNFSIGVALFQRIAARAQELIGPYPQYKVSLNEVHHIHKLDHPSGTAKTTAGVLIGASAGKLKGWTEETAASGADTSLIPVTHQRVGETPGTHTVTWRSEVDKISLEHEAFSRDGFALGAVVAAEWLAANPSPGMHTMAQMLGDTQ